MPDTNNIQVYIIDLSIVNYKDVPDLDRSVPSVATRNMEISAAGLSTTVS